MNIRQIKLHIMIGVKKPRRTTITLDMLLFELIALKLGTTPDDDYAHSIVRQWIEDNIVATLTDADKNISQTVKHRLILEIAQVRLINRRNDWLDSYY